MSFVQREVERVTARLQAGPLSPDKYDQLNAVQQALLWSLEPQGFKSPYDMLVPIEGTQGEREDCPAGSDRTASLNILDLHVS